MRPSRVPRWRDGRDHRAGHDARPSVCLHSVERNASAPSDDNDDEGEGRNEAAAVEDRETQSSQESVRGPPMDHSDKVGDIHCVAIQLFIDCDVPNIATDLRRHGPTIILASCCNNNVAEEFAKALAASPEDVVEEPHGR